MSLSALPEPSIVTVEEEADPDALVKPAIPPMAELATWTPPRIRKLIEQQRDYAATVLSVEAVSDFWRLQDFARRKARAFAGDGRAQKLVLQSLALAQDAELPRVGRVFLYMPLMHAENRALQDECVARFTHLLATTTPELRDTLAGNLRFAYQHLDIIKKFGRFPHRNAALGRVSTPEEEAFLKDGPRFGQ